MTSTVVAAVVFLAAWILTTLLMFTGAIATRPIADPWADWMPNVAMAAALAAVSGALNAVVFGVVAVLSASWRRRRPREVAMPAAVLGVIGSLMSWAGLSMVLARLPGAVLGPVGAFAIATVIPGLLAGALAHAWARLTAAHG